MLGMLQTILAARNNQQDGSWKRLLPIIAIAAVYGIKTLLKAKKTFMDQADEDEFDESPMLHQQADQTPVMTRQVMPALAQQYRKHVPKSVKIKTTPKSEPVKKTSSASLKVKPEKQVQLDKALALDLDDTDALRKAVIYSEILGKPVAMR